MGGGFLGIYNELTKHTRVFGRPVDEDRLAVDQIPRYGPELPGIRGDRAMVAHHEVAVVRNGDLGHGTGVAVHFGDVRLQKRVAVEPHLAVHYADAVTGQPDNPFDVALLRIPWVPEDDDVVAVDGRDVIDELVDKQAVPVFEPGQHAGAFHPDRLIKKRDNQH